jgi:hypothetical protein
MAEVLHPFESEILEVNLNRFMLSMSILNPNCTLGFTQTARSSLLRKPPGYALGGQRVVTFV